MYHLKRIKTLQYWVLSFSLLFGVSALAKGNNEVADAQKHVMRVTSGVVKKLGVDKAKYQRDAKFLDAMIRRDMLPFIDFDAMSKLTLGKHWRKASPAQRVRFTNAYRNMLVRSYGKIMFKYAGASIRAGNSIKGRKAGYVKVRTIVTPRGGAPIAANYDVRNTSGSWKAYNVQVGGINIMTNFRTNFTREVSQKGLDALIARLEKIKR
ncbi:MAG: ABC transporter substrate-binding protein [Cocleimonas sp.]